MEKVNKNLNKKNVLFVGTSNFVLESDKALQTRFEGMSNAFNVFVMGRGDVWHVNKFDCEFFLTPKKIGLFFWIPVAFIRSLFVIYSRKIDVIVAQSPSFDGFVATCLKKITGKELIVEVHGDWVDSLFFYYKIPMKRLVRWVLIMLGKFSLKNAKKVRTISKATRKLVEKYSDNNNFYNFITFTDIDIFKNEKGFKWEPVILYVGVLYRLKGVHFLIEAFQRLSDKYKNFKLVIVGDGPYESELKQLISKKPRNIEMVGRKPLKEVRDIMKNCTALVLPSLSEGLGRVLVEAAMLRKALIGSNVDGIPDIVQDGKNGFLIEPGNVDELTVSLEKLMSNQDLAKKMGEEGRQYVEDKFSTEGFYRSYEKMVND